MQTKLFLNGKRITQKAMKERIGEEMLTRLIKSVEVMYFEDPLVRNDFL